MQDAWMVRDDELEASVFIWKHLSARAQGCLVVLTTLAELSSKIISVLKMANIDTPFPPQLKKPRILTCEQVKMECNKMSKTEIVVAKCQQAEQDKANVGLTTAALPLSPVGLVSVWSI